jgi:hypothetical protein
MMLNFENAWAMEEDGQYNNRNNLSIVYHNRNDNIDERNYGRALA